MRVLLLALVASCASPTWHARLHEEPAPVAAEPSSLPSFAGIKGEDVLRIVKAETSWQGWALILLVLAVLVIAVAQRYSWRQIGAGVASFVLGFVSGLAAKAKALDEKAKKKE